MRPLQNRVPLQNLFEITLANIPPNHAQNIVYNMYTLTLDLNTPFLKPHLSGWSSLSFQTLKDCTVFIS